MRYVFAACFTANLGGICCLLSSTHAGLTGHSPLAASVLEAAHAERPRQHGRVGVDRDGPGSHVPTSCRSKPR